MSYTTPGAHIGKPVGLLGSEEPPFQIVENKNKVMFTYRLVSYYVDLSIWWTSNKRHQSRTCVRVTTHPMLGVTTHAKLGVTTPPMLGAIYVHEH